MSLTVLVDYDSGNLHSAEKAFQRMAAESGKGAVLVSSRPEDVARADRIVLPGDGAFAACRQALGAHGGLYEAISEGLAQGKPFLGICVGMQMLATWGREYGDTPGFDWIGGEVVRIAPQDPALKVPHMGWNDLVIDQTHPVLAGIETGESFSHRQIGDMNDQRVKARASLCLVDAGHRKTVARIAPKPVDRLGRKGHQAAVTQQVCRTGDGAFRPDLREGFPCLRSINK